MLLQRSHVNQTPGGPAISLVADSGTLTKAPVAAGQGESHLCGPAENPHMSERIREALAEEPDPGKSLAEVRRILVGPTQRLHEARTEELILIMEEYDSAVQQSLASLEKRCSHLTRSSEKLLTVSENLQRNMTLQSDYVTSEFRKVNGENQKLVVDLLGRFNMRLAEVAAELRQELDSGFADCQRREKSLAAEFGKQIAQLATQVSASSERHEPAAESQIERSEVQPSRRHRETFANGFSDIADRLLALRSRN